MLESGNTVETVVLLSQQKPDDTIEIDLDLDELDATSAETKATYQEIKDYVLKEFGLKVSSLYISQIKRKCGIEVGENYNLPKSENARVPQCPKEKEGGISMFVHNDRYAEYMNKMDEGLCPECGGSLEHLEEDGVYKCTSCSFWVEEDYLEDAWI